MYFYIIAGKHSLDPLTKTAMLETSHIPSVSGGEHYWFKRINLGLYDGDLLYELHVIIKTFL